MQFDSRTPPSRPGASGDTPSNTGTAGVPLPPQNNAELAILHSLHLALLEADSPPQGLERALDVLEGLFSPNILILYTLRTQVLAIRTLRQRGVQLNKNMDQGHLLGECLCGWAAARKEALVVHEIAHDPRCVRSECKMAGIRSLAAIPLQAGGQLLGLLTLGRLTPHAFAGREALLQSAASAIALGLRNAILAEESARRLQEQREAEAATRLSDELFRTIVENIPAIIGIFDSTGKPRYWNRASARHLGGFLSHLDEATDPVAVIFPDATQRAQVWAHFHAATGEFKDFTVQDELGAERQHSWANFRLADGSVVGIGLDVTEQRAAHQALEQARRELEETVSQRTKALQEVVLHLHEQILANDISQQELHNQASLLHHILSTIPYCVFWKDAQLNFLGCNMRFATLSGLSSPEEIVGKSDFDMPWAETQASKYRAADAEIIASGQPRLHILEHMDQGGRVRVLETSKTPLHNAAGEVVGVLGIFADITERIPLEEQLRASEEKYRTLYNILPEAFAVQNLRGRYIEWNPAFSRLVGYEDKELQTLSCLELTPLQWQAKEREIIQGTVIGQGQAAIYEKEFLSKDGRVAPVELHAFPLRDERGEIAGVGAVVRDISRQKQMEQSILDAKRKAEEASQAKTEFMARMSHEIRTPMNAILGVAQLTDAATTMEQCRESLDIVKEASEGLMVVLNDILDISRMESLGVSFSPQSTDIGRLARSLVASLEHQAAAKRLALTLAFAPTEPPRALVDPDRLRQVLFNLLHNALKFTHQGGVALHIRHAPSGSQAMELTCIVEDTGIGIPDDKLPHIFDTFYQVDGGLARRFGGSGLGLAICRQLVERMGGSLVADSIAGRGSRFTVRLRLPLAGDVAGEAHQPRPTEAQDVLHQARVLLVEDNPLNLRVTASLLHRLGCQVFEAASGLQALEMASLHAVDAILMDIEMPGLDGFQTHARLRAGEAGEQAAQTPVVAFTAHATTAFREECLRRGMAEHVSKPVDLHALRRALIKTLTRARHSDAPSPGAAPDAVSITAPGAALGEIPENGLPSAFPFAAASSPGLAAGVPVRPPLLDTATALRRLDNDATLLREAISTLRQELPERMAALRASLVSGALAELHLQAHTLKSLLATVGAAQATVIADDLSAAARSGDALPCQTALARLTVALVALLPALEQASGPPTAQG